MLKREWGAESNGKLPHLFISSKTSNFDCWVCGERLAFAQNYSLGASVCSKRPVLGQNTNDDILLYYIIEYVAY